VRVGDAPHGKVAGAPVLFDHAVSAVSIDALMV
jgi:hypothetical protein